MCCDSSTQLVSRVERETVNGMYLGHSFRLEYLHFGTGDLEKTEMNRELSIRNLGNQSMECVATLVTQLVLNQSQ